MDAKYDILREKNVFQCIHRMGKLMSTTQARTRPTLGVKVQVTTNQNLRRDEIYDALRTCAGHGCDRCQDVGLRGDPWLGVLPTLRLSLDTSSHILQCAVRSHGA